MNKIKERISVWLIILNGQWNIKILPTAFRMLSTDSKQKKRGKSEINKKELDLKIAKYKIYYNECIHISDHLMDRYYGA